MKKKMGGSCISYNSNYVKMQTEDKRGRDKTVNQINSFNKEISSSNLNENQRKNNGHNTKSKAFSNNKYGYNENIGKYNSGNTKSYKKESKKRESQNTYKELEYGSKSENYEKIEFNSNTDNDFHSGFSSKPGNVGKYSSNPDYNNLGEFSSKIYNKNNSGNGSKQDDYNSKSRYNINNNEISEHNQNLGNNINKEYNGNSFLYNNKEYNKTSAYNKSNEYKNINKPNYHYENSYNNYLSSYQDKYDYSKEENTSNFKVNKIYCGIRGLVNNGNNCFLNSTIQCLKHCLIFTKYIIYAPVSSHGAFGEYKKLIENMCQKDLYNRLNVNNLKKTMIKYNNIYSDNAQHDSTIFFNDLLNALNFELKGNYDDDEDDDISNEESFLEKYKK